jgi:DNA (cytosine-5)-methyltransferase 1
MTDKGFSSLEICAGAGGQALGLEQAGFHPVLLVDNDAHSCVTLRTNRPQWTVLRTDLTNFVGSEHDVLDVDLLSGGVPKTPYSVAGSQRGTRDDRDLLRAAVYLAMEVRPRAVLIENVPSLVTSDKFAPVRDFVEEELRDLGYDLGWEILDAQNFGVPQTRRSGLLVAMRPADFARFHWPEPHGRAPTVGEVLLDSMAKRGWSGAVEWARRADRVAPAIVGGSKNHGGADLGPTRTKQQWAELGVNGGGIGDDVPDSDFVFDPNDRRCMPKLTVPQVAKLQGFPEGWMFAGGKTAQYRQVAQALPPPVAAAVGWQIAQALTATV